MTANTERVSSGSFGACLMAEPELVRDCVAAMAAAVKVACYEALSY